MQKKLEVHNGKWGTRTLGRILALCTAPYDVLGGEQKELRAMRSHGRVFANNIVYIWTA